MLYALRGDIMNLVFLLHFYMSWRVIIANIIALTAVRFFH
jgi:hypothetical protein